MYKHIVLLLTTIGWIHMSELNSAYKNGGPCDLDDDGKIFGICEIRQKCDFAENEHRSGRHSPLCHYDDNTAIVCCPKNSDHKSGILARYFLQSVDGAIRNYDTVCRYNGRLPMICCPQNLDYPEASEPSACPRLKIIRTPPFTNPAHAIAWKKCVANQRYVDICEQDEITYQYRRSHVCNVTEMTQRIIEGQTARPSEFPHMAVLGCAVTSGEEDMDILWVGAGSLISELFILTAGHVLVSEKGHLRYALLGTRNKTDIARGDLYFVAEMIPHKLYVSSEKYHDIALLRLDRRVKFSSFIRPICLPIPGIEYDNTRIVAGWGKTENGERSKMLMKAYLTESNPAHCAQTLRYKNFVWNNNTMICAAGPRARSGKYQDSCQGDSGGPLMAIVKNREFSCNYVIVGVVSWGTGCGGEIPGAYTRVSAYVDWIVQHVWRNDLQLEISARNMNLPSL